MNTEDDFEKSLQHSVQATIIAGDALNALQSVELHAVTIPSNSDPAVNQSSTVSRALSQYDRPFTPDFSSITSGGSSVTNTPLKDETRDHSFNISSIMTDSSFSSAVSTQPDTEATPTNKSDTTFNVSEKTPTLNGSIFSTTEATTKTIQSPRSKSMTVPQTNEKSINHTDANSSSSSSSSSMKTPSFKLFDGKNNKDDTSSTREFNGIAFMQDCTDSLSEDDDFGDFDTADGGFEELLT